MPFPDLQRRAAEVFVAGTRKAPPQLRRRAMDGPARRLLTSQIFAGMARSFDRARGADLDAVVRWEVGPAGRREERWDLVIGDGNARARRVREDSGQEPPRTTIGLDHQTLLELATGLLNAPQAYLAGRLQMRGDVMLAQRLTTLFVVPGAAKAKTRPAPGAGSRG